MGLIFQTVTSGNVIPRHRKCIEPTTAKPCCVNLTSRIVRERCKTSRGLRLFWSGCLLEHKTARHHADECALIADLHKVSSVE